MRFFRGSDAPPSPRRENPPDDASRQVVRNFFRGKAWVDVNRSYGPEPRKARRRMSLRIARRMAKEFREWIKNKKSA